MRFPANRIAHLLDGPQKRRAEASLAARTADVQAVERVFTVRLSLEIELTQTQLRALLARMSNRELYLSEATCLRATYRFDGLPPL